MRRRSFLRTGALAAFAAPSVLSRPAAAEATLRKLQQSPQVPRPIRLASNENPLGMPESARRAILAAMADGNRYPRLTGDVAKAVAMHHGVHPSNVVLGNGSTEVLQMVVQHVARQGGRLIIPDPTFEHVEQYAKPFGIEIVKVPLAKDFTHDLTRMRELAEKDARPALVFICNPNNPTGGLTSCDDVESWIRSAPERVLFLVDEAYFDFVTSPKYRSMLPLINDRKNLLVARTFSKIYALAGLRLGYALAHNETAFAVRQFSQNSNLNHFALSAALAVLPDQAFRDRSLASNAAALRVAEQALDELGLERLPTQANFIMHRVPGELQPYIERMREREIWVGRPFPPMTQYNRVSLGTPEEMGAWAQTLRDFRKQNLI